MKTDTQIVDEIAHAFAEPMPTALPEFTAAEIWVIRLSVIFKKSPVEITDKNGIRWAFAIAEDGDLIVSQNPLKIRL